MTCYFVYNFINRPSEFSEARLYMTASFLWFDRFRGIHLVDIATAMLGSLWAEMQPVQFPTVWNSLLLFWCGTALSHAYPSLLLHDHVMTRKHVLHYHPFERRIRSSPVAFYHKQPTMLIFDNVVVAILNKPVNRQSGFRWFEMSYRECDVNGMGPWANFHIIICLIFDWSLAHWCRATHICANKLTTTGADKNSSLAGAKPLFKPMLGYFQLEPRNKLQWNLKWHSYIFNHKNAFANVVCEMAAILSRPQ